MSIYQGDKKVANVYNINNNSYSVPIGCIIPFSGNTIPVGFLLCDGSEVSKITYADLYKVIADIYGVATDTSKFKLPDLRDKFVQGANGNLGTSKEAGLPNITGKFYHDTNAKAGLSGAFTYESTGRQNLMNDTPTNSGLITFDASKSNPIYGNSNTVQPPSVCLAFIIKAEKISDQYADAVSALIDDTSVSANKVWSSQKVNEKTAQNFDSRIILSVGRETSGGYTNTANLNSANGAYLYWSSTAGQEKYSVGVILYIRNGWTIIPIKETDGGTNITFSIAGNVLTMEKSSSTFPSAGGVIALGTSL